MFNGFLHAAYGEQAFDEGRLSKLGLASTTDGDKVMSFCTKCGPESQDFNLTAGRSWTHCMASFERIALYI
jgi:hypothetical protein